MTDTQNPASGEAIVISASETRKRFAEVLHETSVHGRTYVITSNGRKIAAVVPLAVAEAADTTTE